MIVEFVGGPKDGMRSEIPDDWRVLQVPISRATTLFKPLPVPEDSTVPYATHLYDVVGRLAIYRGCS